MQRAYLARTMTDLSFTPCQADPDGMAGCNQQSNQTENPGNGKRYGTPDHYLGANIGLYTLLGNTSGKQKWYMSSDDYVADAIKNVEGNLVEANRRLCIKVSTLLTVRYRPELDMTRLLPDEQANYFQNLIGVLHWALELGQIDIHVQVAMLQCYPAIWHSCVKAI